MFWEEEEQYSKELDLSCKPFRNCLAFECSQKNSHSCIQALLTGVKLSIFHFSECLTLVSSLYRKQVQHLWRYHGNNYCHLCLTSMIKDIDHVLEYWGDILRIANSYDELNNIQRNWTTIHSPFLKLVLHYPARWWELEYKLSQKLKTTGFTLCFHILTRMKSKGTQ